MNYRGKHISGKGSLRWLELIDRSFSMLGHNPELPSLAMLYDSEVDRLSEGFIWRGWWMQNSYGFALGAIPLLSPFWSQILQNSYDAFWDRMGDGRRMGADGGEPSSPLFALVAPDGALGDCVLPEGIVYKQGDGDFGSYDWFYEATAAGVNLQADILLFDRRPERLAKYLPLIWRSLDHIESTRAENGLFLVGPACNLLAPSYGGSFDGASGKAEKGYLTGLAITYSAALKKCIELFELVGDREKADVCRERLAKNLSALPALMTDGGYFVKSMDPSGELHGVYGAPVHGYFEAVCNVDAIAGDVVDKERAEKIYENLASVEGIRPVGAICNNFPHLDDTPKSYKNRTREPDSFGKLKSGDWVDGGCWGTVEGRAILAYMKLGKYEDAYRAARLYMDWAEEYRQDAPLTQWGRNVNNHWAKESDDHTRCERPVAVMIDNFATATCLLRGLFEYRATRDGLWVIPHLPSEIEALTQKEPIRFGGTDIYISYGESNPPGQRLDLIDGGVFLPACALCGGAVKLTLSKDGGYLESIEAPTRELALDTEGLPDRIAETARRCFAELKAETDPLRRERLEQAVLAAAAAAERRRLPFDKFTRRPMTDERRELILSAYDGAVTELCSSHSKKQ